VLHAKEESRLLKFETELDAAVLDASRWTNVCDALAALTEGAGTGLIPFEPTKRAPWMVFSDSIGELADQYIREGWYKRDHRDATRSIMRRRGYTTDYDVYDQDTFRSHAYYQEFMGSAGFGVFIGIHIPTAEGDWCAAIQRPLSAGAPSQSVLEYMPQLRVMLTAAVRASRAIGAAGIENWRAHFDSPECGFALLNRDGRVNQMNGAAENLLQPFMRATRELAFPDSIAGAHIAELTARACALAPRHPLPPPVLLPLPGGRSLALDAAPLPSKLRHFHIGAVAMLTVRIAETPVIDRSAKLERELALTAAEARLALRIGSGQSLHEAAEAETVTYETARTRLKSIFAKTGTSRQAELALLVERLGVR
jgi:DNA-binding CsgD family transcriptional regulator